MRGDPIPVRKVPKFGPTILAHIASEMFDVYFWMNRELSEFWHMKLNTSREAGVLVRIVLIAKCAELVNLVQCFWARLSWGHKTRRRNNSSNTISQLSGFEI